MTAVLPIEDTWVDVCGLDQLLVGRGVAALVHGEQVALFRVGSDEVLAISNYDPFSGAFVLSRGLVGSVGDEITVASPVYKQRFALRSGRCVDDPAVEVAVYPVRVHEGRVHVSA